jgi:hypothetical protein
MPRREVVRSPADAQFMPAVWWHNYTTVRPHSKLGGKTTGEIAGIATSCLELLVKQPVLQQFTGELPDLHMFDNVV